ncbi:MAG: L-aspartate oxidase [Bacillota bacterium]|nr:L-aspartate oxidase [Bacillota bacterium]
MDICTDVLIVGSGVAGLYAALNLSSRLNVTLITKTTVDECNTYLAQGGISTARNKQDEPLFIDDTLRAGVYKNDINAVKVLAEESMDNIENLVNYGVAFDLCENGYEYTREGAHSVNRIVHCADETGRKVFEALWASVKKKKNVTIYQNTELIDIIRQGNICCGSVTISNGKILNIHAKATILASGGIGGLFKNSTNQRTVTGDGIAIAIRNNIALKDLEYIQFHPTALYEVSPHKKRFLISESVRGEGGKLINSKGERFIDELLPRNVVANAIYEEENRTKSPYVFLDISAMKGEFIVNRFPLIYSECKKRGIDITKQFIPVTPVQHYFMGGIQVDTFSRTSMENLFACGEVSCTGVHGANRLASNSLLEGLVFSRRAAKFINDNIHSIDIKITQSSLGLDEVQELKRENRSLAINKFKLLVEDKADELVSC